MFFISFFFTYFFFSFLSFYGFHDLTDGPEKGRQLSGQGGNNVLLRLASGQETSVAGTEADLRFPANLSDAFRQSLLALEQDPGDPGA